MANSRLKNKLSILNLAKLIGVVERILKFAFISSVYLIAINTILKIYTLTNQAEYAEIISIGEKGTIIIATIAVLTFTYALTMDYPDKKIIQNSGKYFFMSVLDLIIGIVLLIGFQEPVIKLSNTAPDIVSNLCANSILILYAIGFVMLGSSAIFFMIGMTDLYTLLRKSIDD